MPKELDRIVAEFAKMVPAEVRDVAQEWAQQALAGEASRVREGLQADAERLVRNLEAAVASVEKELRR